MLNRLQVIIGVATSNTFPVLYRVAGFLSSANISSNDCCSPAGRLDDNEDAGQNLPIPINPSNESFALNP